MATKNLRQFEFKLGKLGVTLFIAGLSILVFAGFLIGVQVGRNIDTYPEMIARGVPGKVLDKVGLSSPAAKPEVTAAAPVTEQVESSAGEAKTSEKTAEKEPAAAVMMAPSRSPEVAGEKKETPEGAGSRVAMTPPMAGVAPVVTSPAPLSEKTPKAASEGNEKGPVKPATPPVETKKEKTVADVKKDAKKEEKKVQKKEAPPDKNGKFTIQVVSFREKEKAEQLGQKIREMGYTPKVVVTQIPGKGEWYRVTINNFNTKENAEKVAGDLTKKIKGVNCVVRSNS